MTETANGDTQQYNAIFADRHFEQITLGKLLNKGGAAGKVYEIADMPKKVAKIFHERQKIRLCNPV